MADAGDAAAAPGAAADEQEAAQDFSSMFQRVRGKRCTVSGVSISGNKRTKDHVILREMQPARLRCVRGSARALVLMLCAGYGGTDVRGGEGRAAGVQRAAERAGHLQRGRYTGGQERAGASASMSV